MRPSSIKLIPLFLFVLGVASCSPLVKPEQTVYSEFEILENNQTIGQTFMARYDGLTGVEVYLDPEVNSTVDITLHLRSDTEKNLDLTTASLQLQGGEYPGYYRFLFSPLDKSTNQDYYLFLKLNNKGILRLGSAQGDSYLNGALYHNSQPRDAQLAFRLVYDPYRAFTGIGRLMVTWLRYLVIGFFLYALPGWAISSWLLSSWGERDWVEKLSLSVGVSIAIYPLLFLWTDLVGLHLGAIYAWFPPLIGIVTIAYRNWSWVFEKSDQNLRTRISAAIPRDCHFDWPGLVLAVVMAQVFAARFWVIHNLEAPMWGDSYQHAMIAQLLVDNKGLFNSWEPYTPYQSLTVHYGFSAMVALFAWLTNNSIPETTLLTGQILNGLSILALYPLAKYFSGGNRWAGIGAVLLAGLLSPMPAYYVNWGRYAQLAGQTTLPIAFWFLIETIESQWKRALKYKKFALGEVFNAGVLRGILLTSAILAGMALTYYRMPIYFATFTLAWLVIKGLSKWRLNIKSWFLAVLLIVLIAGFSFVLVYPWGLRVLNSKLAAAVEAGLTVESSIQQIIDNYKIWNQVTFFVPTLLTGFALAGFIWSLVRKQWMVSAIILWTVLLSAYLTGQLIGLPGANLMQNFAILIALYIPVGLTGGWLVGQVAEFLENWKRKYGRLIIGLTLTAAALWGTWNQRNIAQPATFAMVTSPDLKAMSWIREKTPQDAIFLVEGFRIYAGRSAVGADAGWWIPLLTGRQNTMPPQYALVNEAPSSPDYTQDIVDLVANLEEVSPASGEGTRLLCKAGITHIYVGQGQGKVGAGVSQLFNADEFKSNLDYKLVYHQDRVHIFSLERQVCN